MRVQYTGAKMQGLLRVSLPLQLLGDVPGDISYGARERFSRSNEPAKQQVINMTCPCCAGGHIDSEALEI